MEKKNTPSNKELLYKYAGLATQLMVSLGLAVLVGWWIDKKINFHFPIAIWLAPLIILLVILFKVVKDTSAKN